MLAGGHALVPETGNDGLDSGASHVTNQVGNEVDAPHQGTAVDPLGAGVPAFHAGGIEQVLTHVGGLPGEIADTGGRELGAADHLQSADHYLGGVLQPGEAGFLEEIGVEEDTQDRLHVVVGVDERISQRVDGVLVSGRGHGPRRDLGLVSDEEVVQVAGDEVRRGRLLANDVDDVLTVEVAGLAQEGLLAFVMVVSLVLEEPVEPADGSTGELRLDGPAGESAGTLANVNLGVAAHAQAEELQQLTAPVLIDGVRVVLVVVQPVDHGRVLGHLEQQFLVVAHAEMAELDDHVHHVVVVVNLGNAGRENLVPEQRHLLFQGPLGVEHVVYPLTGAHARQSARPPSPRVIPHHFDPVYLRLFLGIEKLFHGRLVALGCSRFQLLTGRTEPRPAHKVCH